MIKRLEIMGDIIYEQFPQCEFILIVRDEEEDWYLSSYERDQAQEEIKNLFKTFH